MWNHSLIDRHILVKAIQVLSIFLDNVWKLPQVVNFIESRILSGETLGVVSQVKVPSNLVWVITELTLSWCTKCLYSSKWSSLEASQFPYESMALKASILSLVTGSHFLLCYFASLAACWSWYLFVSATIMSRHTSYVISKHLIKKCTCPCISWVSLSWPRWWFNKWPLCWWIISPRPL